MRYLITEASMFKSLKAIKRIKEIIEEKSPKEDGYIDLGEFEPESSPTLDTSDGKFHQVEAVYTDKAAITIYQDSGWPDGEYGLEYEKIQLDVLEDILDILEGAIEDNLFEV
jgi:hypothetical protein